MGVAILGLGCMENGGRVMPMLDREVTVKSLKIAALGGLFVASFVVFLLITFPYEVLKEYLAAELSQSTGYSIRIGELSSALPLGVTAEKVTIETPNGNASMTLRSLKAYISVMSLLQGQVRAGANIGAGAGDLDVALVFSIFDLVSGQVVPRRIEGGAKNFPVDELVSFGLGVAAGATTANPMVAPLLGVIGMSAQLNGHVDFKLDAKNPIESTGSGEISLAKAVLKLSKPPLGLPDQQFKKAVIKAKIEGGSLQIDPASGFVADEMELLATGKVALKPQVGASILDLNIRFKLNKGLKDGFGFVIDGIVGSASNDGQITMQLRGPMNQPAVTTI